jgi:hypothetical protein
MKGNGSVARVASKLGQELRVLAQSENGLALLMN